MNEVQQPFGRLLKEHRLAAGLSQEQLAERARVSVETISALERGARQRPYIDTIAMLADALHLSYGARVELEQAAARRDSALAAAPTPPESVTFLFTSIEGGISRWESSPDAMAAAVARHDELMRRTIQSHGGNIFRKSDEGFCAVFASVEDAADAAVHAQRAVKSQDFSGVDGLAVRMAVHNGRAEVRHGEYVGPALGHVARLLDVARGGQIVVSAAAQEQLRGALPRGASLYDLGPHRLRDLAQPANIYQLAAPGIGESVPPLRSLKSLPNNLRAQLSSFVGREKDVAEVEQLIVNHRLVTLVGAGGVGKTRIALRVASCLLDGSLQGVWFVDFAPITDGALVPNAIATSVAMLELRNRPPLETLITYLKNKHLLLVLDNCEHLVEEVAKTTDAILQLCPRVHILTTSREVLGVGGEQVYRVPSLSVPSQDELRTLNVEEALTYAAVALFVDRAAAADRRFALTERMVPVVAEICRRLDGIALAIELAAARVNTLSVTTLAQRLNERFLVLTGGRRTALPRHKTMRALLDWSYDLLEDREQGVLRRLSIFAGGFTLELATALFTQSKTVRQDDVLDLVASLVDKSLVQVETVADATRYRLLESTRQYALEKLQGRGEYGRTARALALALLELGERFDSPNLMPDRIWAAQAKPEVENARAALEWAFGSRGDPRIGQRLAGVRGGVWFGVVSIETRHWVRLALKTCDDATPPEVRAKLLLEEARIAQFLGQGQNEATRAAANRALTLYAQAEDGLGVAEAQLYLGRGFIHGGRIAEGENLVRAALAAARSHAAEKVTALATQALAASRYFRNDLEAARRLYREVLTLCKASECDSQVAVATYCLAEVEFQAGDIETALRLGREAAEVLRANSGFSLASVLSNCSAYLIALTRLEEARNYAREAIVLAREAGFDFAVTLALQHLAATATLRAHAGDADLLLDLQRAAYLLGFVNVRFSDPGWARQYTEQQEYDRILPVLRTALGAALDEHVNEGKQWSQDQAVAVALNI